MKRLVLAGLLVALVVSGLCLAGIWSGQGTAMTYSDVDPNDGGDAGPERLMGISIQPVWLADDPNEPDEPIDE
jgi:hypothetical protein